MTSPRQIPSSPMQQRKFRKATTKRDTAVSEKKTAMTNLASKSSAHKKVEKKLLDAKKKWPMQRRRLRISQRSYNKLISGHQGVDSIKCYREKERMKLTASEEKTAMSRQNKETED